MSLLPLFPLKLVVFPSEQLPLHIFEPRYKQLIGECRDAEQTFGIPAQFDNRIAEFGTEIRLVEVLREYPNGEMDVMTEGLRAFRVEQYLRDVPEKLYSAAEVEFIENDPITDPQLRAEVVDLLLELGYLLNEDLHAQDPAIRHLSFAVGHKIGMSLGQKVQILSTPNETDRLGFIREHLRKTVPAVRNAEIVLKKVGTNGTIRILKADEETAGPN